MIADRLVAMAGGLRTSWPQLSLSEYVDMLNQFTFNGVQYTLPGDKQEQIDGGLYRQVTREAYKQNGVIFACVLARMSIFSQATFQFRQRVDGRPGKLFGNQDLALLERPWVGGTTSDLLARMEQHMSLGGNSYIARRPGGLFVLRPDWVETIIGSLDDNEVLAWDVDSEVIGYKYTPGGPGSRGKPSYFLANEVAHYAPIPDPEAQFRGMSWITTVVREIMADKAATSHKLNFFENAATPQMVVKLNVDDIKKFKEWIGEFREEYEGQMNAYKTMFLGAGADPTVVGANLQQMEFKITQGAGETRIAAAAGTPPIIVGLSEGLESATYSNYGQARRRFADLTIRWLWQNAAGSLERIVPAPDATSELWYDDRDIPALQEDVQDRAKEISERSTAIFTLQAAGFTKESCVAAVVSDNLELLVPDPNFQSVQVTPTAPGKTTNGVPPKPGAPTLPVPAQ